MIVNERIQSDPSFKAAYPQSLLKTLYDNQPKSKTSGYKYCKEVYITVPVVIYARLDFYLLDAINEKIEVLKSSGLIDYWHYRSVQYFKTNTVIKPRVLKVNQLSGCFYFVIFGNVVSFLIFLGEIFVKSYFKWFQKVLRQFMQTYFYAIYF